MFHYRNYMYTIDPFINLLPFEIPHKAIDCIRKMVILHLVT